jgi:hypothetical protein
LFLPLLALAFAACSGGEGNLDAAVDVQDAARDTGFDAPADAPADAPLDTAEDTADDVVSDDAAVEDAAADAPIDVPIDAPADAPVDAPAEASTNQPPVVLPATGPATAYAGQVITLSVTATDPDGDPLTYTWRQVSPATAGTFATPNARQTTWYSAVLGAATDAVFEVSVSDGRNPAVTSTVTVPLTVPRYATQVQPIFTSNCTGCHPNSAGQNLTAAQSYNNLVNVTAAGCSPTKRVLPGDPAHSALILKITGTGCGDRMPRNNPTYFDRNPGQRITIESWILGGAVNN